MTPPRVALNAFFVAVGVAGLASCAWAAPDEALASATGSPYRFATASRDGIGKIYEGREIAQVMGWQGASWLERRERERQERTDLLVEELHVKPGMTVADIGAGSGFVARRIAPGVLPGGEVVAVDVQPEMIVELTRLAAHEGLTAIKPVLGGVDDVGLAAASVDLALMVDVYHELEFPREVLSSIVRSLKPGGRVVFVEYRAEDPRVPIKALHKMSEGQVRREVEALCPGPSCLVWERTAEVLPWQHMIFFRRP